MTDVYEGSLIRTFRRLEEALRQMAEASKVMGSEELEKKFEEALNKSDEPTTPILPIQPVELLEKMISCDYTIPTALFGDSKTCTG
ncbi:hypothetical protein FOPE_10049 [Fonsecaea pedrosoi]|nr:hypothetical protein FOPE_10049 [Fonsecaea pedrosoi]